MINSKILLQLKRFARVSCIQHKNDVCVYMCHIDDVCMRSFIQLDKLNVTAHYFGTSFCVYMLCVVFSCVVTFCLSLPKTQNFSFFICAYPYTYDATMKMSLENLKSEQKTNCILLLLIPNSSVFYLGKKLCTIAINDNSLNEFFKEKLEKSFLWLRFSSKAWLFWWYPKSE